MLATTVVQEIERLLSQGNLSQRQIARALGVSRGVIATIARGERPDYEARRLESDAYQPEGPVERCGGCGGRVHMPCRLCHVRLQREVERQVLRKHRREARQRALRRLLIAVLQAGDPAQATEADRVTPPAEQQA